MWSDLSLRPEERLKESKIIVFWWSKERKIVVLHTIEKWNSYSHDFLYQCEYVIHIIQVCTRQWQRCDITYTRMHSFRWIFISIKFYVFMFSRVFFFILSLCKASCWLNIGCLLHSTILFKCNLIRLLAKTKTCLNSMIFY